MNAQLIPIRTRADLEAFVDRSRAVVAVLYLHDPHCGVSARAFREVSRLELEVGIVDVGQDHTLGREVERVTGIRHESPQAIVFRDGTASWSASHGRVREAAILEAAR